MDQIIGDIFDKYQVRKNKKQKDAFIDYTKEKAESFGWTVRVESGNLGARNIVVGDPDRAKVVYTAHYDTCARLPFPNFLTPKNFGIYLLYNLLLVIIFFVIAFALGYIIGLLGSKLNINSTITGIIAECIYFLLILLLFCGPANKHTANDNTSGVTVLFGIMKNLPDEQREKVALVFFDLEEAGLIGSSSFAGKHKNIKANTLLVNFDCVSDGEDIMILTKKKAIPYTDQFAKSFPSRDGITVDLTKKAFYPSDQAAFKSGVGIAAFKKTKRGTLYMNRIHTSKDTVYRRENIDFLIDGSIKLAEFL